MGIQFSSLVILLVNDGIRRSIRSGDSSDIEESSSDDDDRISNLPDCVISHILSFLPTSDSMLTALLSRSWKNVWRRYVTKLSFDSTIPPFNANDYDIDLESDVDVRFSRFVDRALILYDKENHLDRFHLQCLRVSKLYDVTRWFDWAIMRGVRSLDLSLGTFFSAESSFFSNYELPSCIFNCKTLEELKLHNVYIVAHHSCLPNLKTLVLRYICFQDDDFPSKLICSCTSLESLELCWWEYPSKLNISSRTLRDLRVYADADLVIDAPALEFLYLCVYKRSNYQIKNLTSLKEAEILHDGYRQDSCVHILQAICNVKILTFHIFIHGHGGHVPGNLFPIFSRLTVLNLEAECCRWGLLFLNNSPKLVHVNILEYSGHRKLSTHELCWKNPVVVPACFISSLESMTIMGLSYSESEIAMAKFTIENARIMRRMNISTCGNPVMEKYRHELLNLSRQGSKECELLVEVREDCKDQM